MRLKVSRSKNAASLYVTKTVYVDKKERTITVEKLGTEAELREKLHGADPYEWAKDYIEKLNQEEKEKTRTVLVPFAQAKRIPKHAQRSFNGGYLFLQQLYQGLGLPAICREISQRHKFDFDLDAILSRLLYSRILYPASKYATNELAMKFIQQPNFALHQIYRALEVIAKESDFIQSCLYKNSITLTKRNTGVLYYDCTNYFFEIEQEAGLRQYGKSKEHRPNPLVQMGLFMDADGIPLAFSITKGNTNEQMTLRPLEEKILSDFALSKFVVCTDAGLASTSNRKFNDKGGRAFITTQSLKHLKKHLREWALDPKGFHLAGSEREYDLTQLSEGESPEKIFYKERWVNEDGLEQKLIVTYCVKYQQYQRAIRNSQIERARKALSSGETTRKGHNQNDPKRFITQTHCTPDGEVAEKHLYSIDEALVAAEEAFDGFYAVCTNLEDEAPEIAKINKRRWEIEECFRIMKSEFKARPVYLQRDDRIEAHFATCFLALLLYRLLEKKLEQQFSCSEMISGLRDMNFYEVPGDGFIPTYTRTDFTDALHDAFGFRTDYEIVTTKQMKKIFKGVKR